MLGEYSTYLQMLAFGVPLVLALIFEITDRKRLRMAALYGGLVLGSSSTYLISREEAEIAEKERQSLFDVSVKADGISSVSEANYLQAIRANEALAEMNERLRSRNDSLMERYEASQGRELALQVELASVRSDQLHNAAERRSAEYRIERRQEEQNASDLQARRVAHCVATYTTRRQKRGFGNLAPMIDVPHQLPTNKELLGEGECYQGEYITADHPMFGLRSYAAN